MKFRRSSGSKKNNSINKQADEKDEDVEIGGDSAATQPRRDKSAKKFRLFKSKSKSGISNSKTSSNKILKS